MCRVSQAPAATIVSLIIQPVPCASCRLRIIDEFCVWRTDGAVASQAVSDSVFASYSGPEVRLCEATSPATVATDSGWTTAYPEVETEGRNGVSMMLLGETEVSSRGRSFMKKA
jgi:hypothetical protein